MPGGLGAWAFSGTRVPACAPFGNLESGAMVSEALECRPGVEEWQVAAVLRQEADCFRTPA